MRCGVFLIHYKYLFGFGVNSMTVGLSVAKEEK